MRALYGDAQVAVHSEVKKRLGWMALTVRSDVAGFHGTGIGVPKYGGRLEIVVDPYWLTGLAFFARYYGGRDYYNAFFVDRVQQAVVGLAWDGERPLKFQND